jgi:hypothetical protein
MFHDRTGCRTTGKMNKVFSGRAAWGAAAALLMVCGFGGCGAESVRSLRQMPDSVYSFEVSADCATVYERIAARARQRYGWTDRRTYQPSVSARLFPEQQAAAVSLSNAGGIGLRYVLHADIHQLDASRTKVDVYCGTARYKKEARLWRLWANAPFAGGREPPPAQAAEPPTSQEPSAPDTNLAPTE